MTKLIELKEKVDDGVNITVIAEYNAYVDEVLVRQFSRSPFSFSSGLTDEEIKADIMANHYYIYE